MISFALSNLLRKLESPPPRTAIDPSEAPSGLHETYAPTGMRAVARTVRGHQSCAGCYYISRTCPMAYGKPLCTAGTRLDGLDVIFIPA